MHKEIRYLISINKIERALGLLIETMENKEYRNSMLIQKSRLNRAKKAFHNSLINWEEFSQERSKISYCILEILNEIEEIDEEEKVVKGFKQAKNIILIKAPIILKYMWMFLVVLLFAFYYIKRPEIEATKSSQALIFTRDSNTVHLGLISIFLIDLFAFFSLREKLPKLFTITLIVSNCIFFSLGILGMYFGINDLQSTWDVRPSYIHFQAYFRILYGVLLIYLSSLATRFLNRTLKIEVQRAKKIHKALHELSQILKNETSQKVSK